MTLAFLLALLAAVVGLATAWEHGANAPDTVDAMLASDPYAETDLLAEYYLQRSGASYRPRQSRAARRAWALAKAKASSARARMRHSLRKARRSRRAAVRARAKASRSRILQAKNGLVSKRRRATRAHTRYLRAWHRAEKAMKRAKKIQSRHRRKIAMSIARNQRKEARALRRESRRLERAEQRYGKKLARTRVRYGRTGRWVRRNALLTAIGDRNFAQCLASGTINLAVDQDAAETVDSAHVPTADLDVDAEALRSQLTQETSDVLLAYRRHRRTMSRARRARQRRRFARVDRRHARRVVRHTNRTVQRYNRLARKRAHAARRWARKRARAAARAQAKLYTVRGKTARMRAMHAAREMTRQARFATRVAKTRTRHRKRIARVAKRHRNLTFRVARRARSINGCADKAIARLLKSKHARCLRSIPTFTTSTVGSRKADMRRGRRDAKRALRCMGKARKLKAASSEDDVLNMRLSHTLKKWKHENRTRKARVIQVPLTDRDDKKIESAILKGITPTLKNMYKARAATQPIFGLVVPKE